MTYDHQDIRQQVRSPSEYIGQRIKAGRGLRGFSMEALGAALGVTFQQIQKYENAKNRVSACALVAIGEALDLDVTFFLPPSSTGGNIGRAELDEVRRSLAETLADFDRVADDLDRRRAALRAHLDRFGSGSDGVFDLVPRRVA